MANRRVSELNELLNTQVAASDLFLITDVSAVESKKIRASELQTYALNGTASYSLRSGTSSYSLFSLSSSYSPATVSASYALSASYADWAKTASYVLSASYALSSSYSSMSFWAITASYALTSSVQLVISSGLADYAYSASYLIYVPGFNNGTSSAAISSSWARMASTASYLLYSGVPNGTASYALTASQATSSSYAKTASFLRYTGIPNGTASYALQASSSRYATYTSKPMLWGMYSATVNSLSESRITTMSFVRPDVFQSTTIISVVGTLILPYTSSAYESASLVLVNQLGAPVYQLDTAVVAISAGGAVSGVVTGSLRQSFTLSGTAIVVDGDYLLYVTASSPNVQFDTNRAIKFRVESQAETITTV